MITEKRRAVFSSSVIANDCGNPFLPPPSLRSRVNGCGNPFSFKMGRRILSRFAFRMTKNEALQTAVLSLRCGCPVDTSAKQKHRPSRQARPPLGARQSVFPPPSLRSRVNGCGNPFSFKMGRRILSRSAFRMTKNEALQTAVFPF